jgi:hypothetical protein
MRSTSYELPEKTECRLPYTYIELVQQVAGKHGWKIERNGSKYYLRSIPRAFVFRRNPATGDESRPSNHLAYFENLVEVHDFLLAQ